MRQNSLVFSVRFLCVATVMLGGSLAVRPACAAPGHNQDEFSVKTPSGGVDVSGSVKAKEIGLPVYPGATYVSDRDKNEGNLMFSLSRPGKPDVKFVVAKFETTDGMQQVRDFYRKKLGSKVTRIKQDGDDGSLTFEMEPDKQHGKFVGIKPAGGRTEIDLVRMEGFDISDSSVK
jgi:hypothetical protein